MSNSEKPLSPETATAMKGGTTRIKKRAAAKGSKEDYRSPGSAGPEEHPHTAFSTRKSVSAKGQEEHGVKPASPKGTEGAPQTSAGRRKSAAAVAKPHSLSSPEERLNVTSAVDKSLAQRKKSVSARAHEVSPSTAAGRRKSAAAGAKPHSSEEHLNVTYGVEKSLAQRKRSVSARAHEEHRPVTAISRKLVSAAAAEKRPSSPKGSEEQLQTAAGKRRRVSEAAPADLPQSPEEHLNVTSGLNKSSLHRKKSVSTKAQEEHAPAAEYDTRTGRKKIVAAPKAAPPVVAEVSGQGHEGQEPRSHVDDGKDVEGGEQVDGADMGSGGRSKGLRPRPRKKPIAAPFIVARMVEAATHIVATKTVGKKESMAEKRAEALKNADKDESGHSELDSQQQHCLALVGALVCTAVLFIGLTIAVYFSKGKGINTRVACATPECGAARKFMDDLLDSRQDRCKDFYRYVCNRWQEKGSSFARDQEDALLLTLDQKLREYAKPPDPLGGHVVVSVYRGCRNYLASHDVLGTALSFTEDKVMSGLMRSAKSFADVVHLMARASLQVGLHTVLWMSLEASRAGEKATLRMAPGKSILRKLAVGDYDELRRVLDTAFTWLPKVYKKDKLSAVIEADRVVEAALEPRSSGAAAPYSMSTRSATGSLGSFVDDLVPGMSAEAWMDALNGALPEKYRIDAGANVTTVTWASVRGALGALASSGMRNTSFYLGANLDAEVAYLEMSREKLKSAGEAKMAKFCLEQCRRIHSLGWESVMGDLQEDQGLKDGAAAVTDIFSSLANSVRKNTTFTWIPDDARVKAHQLAFGTHIEVIHTQRQSDHSVDMSQFEPPAMNTAQDFMFGFFKILEQDNKVALQTPPTHRDVMLQLLEPFGPVSFEGDLEAVLVPSMYLKDPYLYPHGVPMYFNYGTVGTQLATAMAQAINRDPGPSGAGSKSSSWWTDEARERHNRSLLCLESLHQRMGFEFGSDARGGEKETLFIWAQGVRLAYQALMQRFGELAAREDDGVLYMHNARRTFFSRSCLLWCSSDSAGGPLSARERCMVPLHNMREFADTFACTDRPDFVQGECEA